MFDIGFSELVLVFIVGLVVLGPQRLPIAIRTVMGWVRTIRGMAANVQNELAQELKLQELQESIKKAEELNLSKLSPELSKTVEDLKETAQKMQDNLDATRDELTNIDKDATKPAETAEEQALQAKLTEVNDAVESAENLQNSDENAPLAEQSELSSDEIAELAELDEEKFSAYYPPDDELADVPSSSATANDAATQTKTGDKNV